MPKLIVQRKKTQRSVGTVYCVPSSPFQKLVDGTMRRRRLSGREVATMLTNAGAKTSQSTLWTWLHHPNGCPASRSFKPKHARALAAALGIKLGDLHAAHDASRHTYTPKEDPTPAATHDALAVLEESVTAMKGRYVKRLAILHLIQAVRRGCQ